MGFMNDTYFKLEIQELIRRAETKKTALEQQKNKLEQELKEIEVELLAYEQILLLDLSKKGKYAYMTVPAALARFFIERENQESPIPSMFECLTEHGLEIGGKDPLSNLTAVLHADKRFETTRRGIYRLKPAVFQNLKESGHKLRVKIEEVK